MAIRITCPGCKSTLSLADELRGKKVRCKKCETSIKIPGADEEEEKTAITEKRRAAVPDIDDEDDEEDDRPKKKKKKKAKGGISPVLIIAPVLIVALLVVGGVSAYFMTRDPGPAKQVQQAKVEPKKVEEEKPQQGQIFNKREDGVPGKKGGLGVVDSIRGGVFRAERKVELANLNKMYNAFVLETPRGQQTLESFLTYIQRDYAPVHKAIKDGYYIMNMKAQSGSDIVAGERDLDRNGHLVVKYDGTVEYVPEADWKQAMGIK
jgi:DNA-directed RNA polymerase subunit M/transcription elongation factor TFIIS